MACLPCALLLGIPDVPVRNCVRGSDGSFTLMAGLDAVEMTAAQKFDHARYQEMLGLYAKLSSRASALPGSPERTSVIEALNAVRANLNQIGGVSVKSPGSATWYDKIFGSVPQSGSTLPDYMILNKGVYQGALFDRQYNEQMAEMNRIDKYISRLTAAPVTGRPQVSQPDVTDKPLTPSGSSGATPYKSPDWMSYLTQPTAVPGMPQRKPDYTNLIIFTAMIGAGVYLLWPKGAR